MKSFSFLFFFLLACSLSAQDYGSPLTDEQENGKVDWTGQYIEAVGYAVIDNERFPNEAQAKLMAGRGAEVVAKANLLEIVEGIQVYRETTVRDMITESDVVMTRVEGVVKGARVVGAPKIQDGVVEVTVRMPLFDDAGLAPAVEPALQEKRKEKKAALPSEEEVDAAEEEALGAGQSGGQPEFVLNFGETEFKPSLFPVLVDEEGNVLIDFSDFYDSKKGDFLKYVKYTEEIMKELEMEKGLEVVDAIQNFDGTIKVKPKEKGKFGNFLKKIGKAGKVVLPVLLSLL